MTSLPRPTHFKRNSEAFAMGALVTIKCIETGQQWILPASELPSGAENVRMVSLNKDTVKIVDGRTGKIHETRIIDNEAIDATALQQLKDGDMPGLRVFDPSYKNTAVVKSAICYIDGEKGELLYRGYPIEELAEQSNFLEVAYLLIYGSLPTKIEYAEWSEKVMKHTFVHTRMTELMKTFNYDAHPMGMFISSMAAMSTFHPEANPALEGSDLYMDDVKIVNKQIVRILGKVPTVAAAAYRHRIGRPYNMPQSQMGYAENFLYMLDRLSEGEGDFKPDPRLSRALEIMFILHADHEMNCSTAVMRHIGSSRVDPYSAISGAAAALYGPLHGGANEAVLHMLEEIGSVHAVPGFLEAVKQRKKRLMGFGHRVYRNYDPRAKIIRRVAYDVFEVCGKEPLIEVAIALEKAALAEEYFVQRKLYPNVDFYSGLIYRAMGFPTDFFPVLFAIPRVAGWLAHWNESLKEADPKIWRPRQLYNGEKRRPYVQIKDRAANTADRDKMTPIAIHPFNRRYTIATRSKI